MTLKFLRKNWLYFALLLFLIAVNVLPRLQGEKEEAIEEVRPAAGPEITESLYPDFREAKERTEKLEGELKQNPSLYLFYISINLLVIFVFLLGLTGNGYYIVSKTKGREPIERTPGVEAMEWKISDIFKILILALSASYVFFIAIGTFLGIMKDLTGAEFLIFKNVNFRMIFDTIILDLAVFVTVLYFVKEIQKSSFASFGFVKKGIKRNIFYGVAGYVCVMPVILIIGILIYVIINIFKLKPPPQPIVELFLVEKNISLVAVSSVIAAIFGPFIEEIFFRGVMYNAVKKRIGIFWAILITSALFSFLHTHAMSYFLVGFIPIGILGAVLAYLYEKTGSLIPSVTMHILNNVGSVSMVFLFKYFNSLAA